MILVFDPPSSLRCVCPLWQERAAEEAVPLVGFAPDKDVTQSSLKKQWFDQITHFGGDQTMQMHSDLEGFPLE